MELPLPIPYRAVALAYRIARDYTHPSGTSRLHLASRCPFCLSLKIP